MSDNYDHQSSMALIDMLSDDCLIKIFSYLSMEKRLEIEEVCLRWRDIGLSGWNDKKTLVLVDSDPDNPESDHLKQSYIENLLVRCGSFLRTLELVSVCDSNIMMFIREHSLNLTRLVLDLRKYKIVNFEGAFSNMPNLQYLELHRFPVKSLQNSLESLPRGKIEEIHVVMKSYYVPNSFKVFEKFDRLRSLTIPYSKLTREDMEMIGRKENLVHLNLARCHIEEGIESIFQLKNLEKLNLKDSNNLLNGKMKGLVKGCGKLKFLDITLCKGLNNSDFEELAKLENLEELVISGLLLENLDINFAIGLFRTLRILKCNFCLELTDVGLIHLLHNSPNLERLEVVATAITTNLLTRAINITKYRTNNVVLEMMINRYLHRNFDHSQNTSPFLILTTWIEDRYDL